MRAKGSSLFLVKSAPGKVVKSPKFHTEEVVPQSGIYRVRHRKHRLPHEVTLLRDQRFPRCAKCQQAVVFELVQAAGLQEDVTTQPRILLYELPVLDDDQEMAG
jgi:hypothetical protein